MDITEEQFHEQTSDLFKDMQEFYQWRDVLIGKIWTRGDFKLTEDPIRDEDGNFTDEFWELPVEYWYGRHESINEGRIYEVKSRQAILIDTDNDIEIPKELEHLDFENLLILYLEYKK